MYLVVVLKSSQVHFIRKCIKGGNQESIVKSLKGDDVIFRRIIYVLQKGFPT